MFKSLSNFFNILVSQSFITILFTIIFVINLFHLVVLKRILLLGDMYKKDFNYIETLAYLFLIMAIILFLFVFITYLFKYITRYNLIDKAIKYFVVILTAFIFLINLDNFNLNKIEFKNSFAKIKLYELKNSKAKKNIQINQILNNLNSTYEDEFFLYKYNIIKYYTNMNILFVSSVMFLLIYVFSLIMYYESKKFEIEDYENWYLIEDYENWYLIEDYGWVLGSRTYRDSNTNIEVPIPDNCLKIVKIIFYKYENPKYEKTIDRLNRICDRAYKYRNESLETYLEISDELEIFIKKCDRYKNHITTYQVYDKNRINRCQRKYGIYNKYLAIADKYYNHLKSEY